MWSEPRPPGVPPIGWRDWALAGVVPPLALTEALLRPELGARWAGFALVLLLVPALLYRRARPLLVVAGAFTVAGVAMLAAGEGPFLNTSALILLLPYALFRWGSGRQIVLGLGVISAKVTVTTLAGRLALSDAVLGTVLMFAFLTLALALRYRARLRAREVERAALLERERLARDLHDTVAHHVSAMAIRAQAGIAMAALRPEAAVEALQVIEAEAGRALTEMRAVVRRLTPGPGLPEVTALAGRDGAGPVVEVTVSGDLTDVSPAVGSAIYRLAQESVTNARRHAREATRISVNVAAEGDSVRLDVTDDGLPAATGAPGGFGLGGMARRAHSLGGVCAAGPGPERGWTVTATLPRTAAESPRAAA